MSNPNIDFKRIIAHDGAQTNGFEELCCQLARRETSNVCKFERLRGAGGDGGVECIAHLQNGEKVGWQAKYVFNFDNLLKELTKSFDTAITVHDTLAKYIVCFPFDLTGKTARKGKSQSQRFEEWVTHKTEEVKKNGRIIVIENWSASRLQDLLLKHDTSGGLQRYFFSDLVLNPAWFSEHIKSATTMAGPRYTPALNVTTKLGAWFSSFGDGDYWFNALAPNIKGCDTAISNLRRTLQQKDDGLCPRWPTKHTTDGNAILAEGESVLAKIKQLLTCLLEKDYAVTIAELKTLLANLQELDAKMSNDIEAEHGEGSADSKSFRQYMAAYECTFPAGNLDAVRDVATAFQQTQKWLLSPSGFLIFHKAFILSGVGGSGKTHGICDVASSRIAHGAWSCIVYGHQFNSEPNLWTRLGESLGFGTAIGKDALLDTLDTVGEASGKPLIIFIDAINETKPRNYWQQWLGVLAGEIAKRSYLKLCVSCRSSFLGSCWPDRHRFPIVEHIGFEGLEREACNAFFGYYNLEPPLIPVLQPELSNPLYLKLVCETLKLKGFKSIPNGWSGFAPVIRAFIDEKEKAFANETQAPLGARLVSAGLSAIAGACASNGGFAIPWSEAESAIQTSRPNSLNYNLVDWLVKAELLIEDGPGDVAGGESILRPAFERFGDFLIAQELISKLPSDNFENAFHSDKAINQACADPTANAGIIQALSVLVSEKQSVELPNLIRPEHFDQILEITVRAIPWRAPDTFTDETRSLVFKSMESCVQTPFSSLLAICTQPSAIDAIWFSRLLARPDLVHRDAIWCGYLHQQYEDNGIARRLITATADLELHKLDDDTAIRWGTMLLWFTAASDRRVKDTATRALIAVCRSKPPLIQTLLSEFLYIDDDEIRERVLLVSYAILLLSRDSDTLRKTAAYLLAEYSKFPVRFENALLRDHIRCIAELARHVGCLDNNLDPELSTKRRAGKWPLQIPTKVQLEKWSKADGAMYHVVYSALHDDFNHYSIGCLGPWVHEMDKPTIGAWIAGYIGNDLGLATTDCCDNFDKYISYINGGGRSKPAWAERIGKKYQWLALYKLASRLYDNVNEEYTSEPAPICTPLILQQERRMDPTLSITVLPDHTAEDCWWIRKTFNFRETKYTEINSWIKGREDIPTLDLLLKPTEREGRQWIPLSLNITETEHDEDDTWKPSRHAWVDLQAYLVSKQDFGRTIKALHGRNFFGRWLPAHGSWLYTFAGEYPWGTTCNTESDDYVGIDSGILGTDLKFSPATNDICSEWEYDGSLPSSIYIQVPSKLLLPDNKYWWNGTDGFKDTNENTVFFDPRFRYGGPATLLADLSSLTRQLNEMGLRLFWAMLGKKDILGDSRDDHSPENVFSQVAYLNDAGTITKDPCTFFDDEGTDCGVRQN